MIPLMKINNKLIVSILFSLSIFVGALHNLEHAQHSADNCPVCTIKNHTDSADITPEFSELIPTHYFNNVFNAPQQFISSSYTPTLYGRAPPSFS